MFNPLKSFMSGVKAVKGRFGEHVCPFCFNRFELSQTPFRCVGASCFEEDKVRQAVWGDGAALKKVIEADGKYHDRATCPTCKRESVKRLCPHCHMELPAEFGRHPRLVFAMIGAKNTGKSHYLAVLIEQIRKNIGPDLDILLEPLNDETRKRFDEGFRKTVFDDKKVIAVTFGAGSNITIKKPLAYSLTFSSRDRRGVPTIDRVVYLSFFDTAGEDMTTTDTMEAHHRYIASADGVILLFDPLQLPSVRASLPQGTPMMVDPAPEMMMQVVERTIKLIQDARGVSATQQLETPIAVAFSKFDAVEPLCDPSFGVLQNSACRGGFNVADHRQVSLEMQGLLLQWNCMDLLQLVQTRFKHHAFFGLSALGCNPHGDGRIPRVLPRRVEDPLLWLLHQHRYVKSVGV